MAEAVRGGITMCVNTLETELGVLATFKTQVHIDEATCEMCMARAKAMAGFGEGASTNAGAQVIATTEPGCFLSFFIALY